MEKSGNKPGDVTTAEMMGWIDDIVKCGIRRPGWPGQRLAEQYLNRRFTRFGLEDVVEEAVPVNRWKPQQTLFQIMGSGETIACMAIPYTAWTADAGVEAPLVWIGDGEPGDFEGKDLHGKIAVMNARFKDFNTGLLKQSALAVYDPGMTIPDGVLHKANWLITNFPGYYAAQKRGAAGFVGLLVDSPIDDCGHWVPYDGWLKDLPAVWVGRGKAESVEQAARRGIRARLLSTGTTDQVESHNIAAWVRGKSDETILLTCHHDAPWASAVEDASGLAILLGLAKRFGSQKKHLNRNLLFVASSGHFHGGTGNRVFVEKHRGNWLSQTVAALGMEHIAQEAEPDGENGYRLTGRPEVRAIFTENCPSLIQAIKQGIEKHNLDRTLVLPPYLFGPEPPCDAAPYFTAGIASACLISGPLYLFDRHDDPEKVRQEDLSPVLNFFSELVKEIDSMPTEDLHTGLAHSLHDPSPPMPHWFAPPTSILD
ncbi:MAG: M28 family peptidase [bacterium]